MLPSAYLLDALAGDPEWFPHPVRLIGVAAESGEALLRRAGQSKAAELTLGTILTLVLVIASYGLTDGAIKRSRRYSPWLGNLVELVLGWTCVAARNLQQEAGSAVSPLQTGDLIRARARLARVVGRDTDLLKVSDISRAIVETVAESASDGIIAPLFYMALGGVPLSMAYKAINTLDSMIGHTDALYFYFGKSAARLDDVANFLPARLTALAIVSASCVLRDCDGGSAWRTWKRDGGHHKSPNAGQPESALGGALRICLGGESTYGGEIVRAPFLGREFQAPEPRHAQRAIRVVTAASFFGLVATVLLAACVPCRSPR